jgi:DNA-directed RNA polymerase sigma subunit (sigma70/sigma32)
MDSSLCVYAPGPWGNCLDLGCRDRGGRCEYVGGRQGRSRCVCRVGEPSRNVAAGEGLAVEETLELYRSAVTAQPECAEPAFSGWLRRFRDGDEAAGRAISGSCLRIALAEVESRPTLPGGLAFLDAVQEANAGLVEALHSFTGSTAEEFVEHARWTIRDWLSNLDQQQG